VSWTARKRGNRRPGAAHRQDHPGHGRFPVLSLHAKSDDPRHTPPRRQLPRQHHRSAPPVHRSAATPSNPSSSPPEPPPPRSSPAAVGRTTDSAPRPAPSVRVTAAGGVAAAMAGSARSRTGHG
jgi:hypothetical protein